MPISEFHTFVCREFPTLVDTPLGVILRKRAEFASPTDLLEQCLNDKGQVMVAPQCTFIHSAEQQLQWEHSVVEGMCIDEDRVSADTEKEVAGASSSSVPRDETPPKEEVWTKSLGEEDAQQVLEFAQKKMPHLKEMAEGDEDINSSMAGIPEDKSNMLPMDVECLDVMDPAAQGAYADLPVDEAPLFVTRISPSGPTSSFSPQLVVQFSQPMIELTPEQGAVAANLPFIITEPHLEGQWTWEDPQTLTHKANTLLGSSVYSFRVSPHEEAVSVFGATLQRERQVKFTTPRLTVSHSTPTEICTSLNPTCVLGFNQRVDPESIVPYLTVYVRLPDPEDPEKFLPEELWGRCSVRPPRNEWEENLLISKRGVIFGCDRELERSSIVRVHLPSGLQSEEGPLPSLKEYTFSFRVFPKLRVTGHNLCFHTLHPLSHNFIINFSNKIYDPFEPALYPGAKGVTIKPEPANMEVVLGVSHVRISGQFDAETSYTVQIESVTDMYEQTLTGVVLSDFLPVDTFQRFMTSLDVFSLLNADAAGGLHLPFSAPGFASVNVATFKPTEQDLQMFMDSRTMLEKDKKEYQQSICERGSRMENVPKSQLHAALNLQELIEDSPAIVVLSSSTPDYPTPSGKDPSFGIQECRLCDKVFQVQFSVIPSGGFGEVQVFNEVIDGSIPVQGILEMLAEKTGLPLLDTHDIFCRERTVLPRQYTLAQFKRFSSNLSLRVVPHNYFSTYSWVQRSRANHGVVTDGSTLLVGICNEKGDPLPRAKIVPISSSHGPLQEIEAGLSGVAEVPIPNVEDFDCEYFVWRHQGAWGISPVGFVQYQYMRRYNAVKFPARVQAVINLDRGIYKLGDCVGFHGVVRCFDEETGELTTPPLSFFKDEKPAVTFRVCPLEEKFKGNYCRQTHTIWGRFTLPKDVDLDEDSMSDEQGLGLSVKLNLLPDITFKANRPEAVIKAFRRPDFTVDASFAEGHLMSGETAEMVTKTLFQTGDVVVDQEINFRKSIRVTSFKPPLSKEFLQTYLVDERRRYCDFGWSLSSFRYRYPAAPDVWTSRTDEQGKRTHFFVQSRVSIPLPLQVECQASVTDASAQTWSGSDTLTVHPSSVYLGLRVRGPLSSHYGLYRGHPATVDMLLSDIQGNPLMESRPVFLMFKYLSFDKHLVREDFMWCQSGDQEVPFVPAAGSCSLHVVGFVVDNQGRLNASHCQQHISDPPEAPAPVIAPVVEKVVQDTLMQNLHFNDLADALVQAYDPDTEKPATEMPSHRRYVRGRGRRGIVSPSQHPFDGDVFVDPSFVYHDLSSLFRRPTIEVGKTVAICICTTSFPDTAFVTWGRKLFAGYQLVHITSNRTLVEIPISEECVPAIKIQVTFLRSGRRSRAVQTSCLVSAAHRTLSSTIQFDEEEVHPGKKAVANVHVRSKDGNAVPDANVTLVAVDKAIYDLHPHEIVDALHRFYQGDLSYLRTRMQVLGDGFVGVFVRSGVSGRVFRWSISLDSTFQDVLSRLMEIEGSFQVARISCDCLEEGYEDPDGDWSRTLRDCGVRYFDTIVVVEEIMVRYRGGRKRMCDSKKKMKGATASKKMSRDMDSSECSSSSDSDCDEEECEEDEIEEEGSGDGAVKVRQNFDPLAVLRAVALTDAQGCARIEFGTPDTLTKYRVFAFASTKTCFGRGTGELTVRMDFSMRLTIPRFLHVGDQFTAYITLLNFSKKNMEVDVLTHCQNFAILGPVRRAFVPRNKRCDLEVHCTVQEESDEATVTSSAFARTLGDASEMFSDAILLKLPVYLPVIPEEIVDAGVLEAGEQLKGQKVVRSDAMITTYGHIRLEVSRAQMSQLSGMASYLWSYWMDCTEQLSSTIVALTHVFHHETALSGVSLEKRRERISACLGSLQKRCSTLPFHGTFYWKEPTAEPLSTLLSFHACLVVQQFLPTEPDLCSKAADLMQHILPGVVDLAQGKVVIEPPRSPCRRHQQVLEEEEGGGIAEDMHQKALFSAFAGHLQQQYLDRVRGEDSSQAVEDCLEFLLPVLQGIFELEDFSASDMDTAVFTLGLLHRRLLALQRKGPVPAEGEEGFHRSVADLETKLDMLVSFIGNSFEDDGTYLRLSCPYVTSAVDNVLIFSNIRTSSWLLSTLVDLGAMEENKSDHFHPAVQPLLGSVHRLARGILKARLDKGVSYFNNSQKNAMALDALSRYFGGSCGGSEAAEVKMVYAGSLIKSLSLHAGDTSTSVIPMHQVSADPQALFLHKVSGPPVFYEIGFRCARTIEAAVRVSRNFSIKRSLLPVYKESELVSHSEREVTVKLNSLVVVSVVVGVRSTKYHVSLVDRLPACFEFVDESLAGSEKIMHDQTIHNARSHHSFNSLIVKDHAVICYSSNLYPSAHHLTYVVRATSCGRFIMPATKVEEMYSPENYALDIPVVVNVVA